jgi:hypothetical protein
MWNGLVFAPCLNNTNACVKQNQNAGASRQAETQQSKPHHSLRDTQDQPTSHMRNKTRNNPLRWGNPRAANQHGRQPRPATTKGANHHTTPDNTNDHANHKVQGHRHTQPTSRQPHHRRKKTSIQPKARKLKQHATKQRKTTKRKPHARHPQSPPTQRTAHKQPPVPAPGPPPAGHGQRPDPQPKSPCPRVPGALASRTGHTTRRNPQTTTLKKQTNSPRNHATTQRRGVVPPASS